jgi:hypothetical protein
MVEHRCAMTLRPENSTAIKSPQKKKKNNKVASVEDGFTIACRPF